MPRTDSALQDLLRDALTDDDRAALHRIHGGGRAAVHRLVATALAPEGAVPPRTENA